MTVERNETEELMARIERLEGLLSERSVQFEESNKELDAFSYSISHDLRAPLRHIRGFSKLLLERLGGADETAAQYAGTIAAAADRLGRMIDDLLALSRAGRSELHARDVDLNGLLGDARTECMRQAKDRSITWKIGELPSVRGDPALLRIALFNLLSNAVKFTRERSAAIIEVGASREETGEIVLCVRDNGAGFDTRYAGKLFGVFQRLHREDQFEGTGAGLAIVQRIVRRHGGRIWAEGEPGKGAAFYVAFNEPPSR